MSLDATQIFDLFHKLVIGFVTIQKPFILRHQRYDFKINTKLKITKLKS